MSSLADREKLALLEIARRALIDRVEHGRKAEMVEGEALLAGGTSTAGAFVTLRNRGKLRGCIGQIGTGLPLAFVVAHSAGAAATEDPRFRPIQAEELGDVEIEISVLSEPEEITPEAVAVGKHGLIVSQGNRRGLLLPQVAEEFHLTPQRFLEETCVKAGLSREAWKDPRTRIEAFRADVFREKRGIAPELRHNPE